ncbi:unnamed protein product [Rotaria sordida]|uniref:Reverse transcriptase/retrotransposon-derived protein RNase H-like domain-containing protein n=1 Tax=Rotaria sordida TaxID=392033 RepID=A0A815JGN0_9BILA|nr:unnamed protein product [Rotaria sordida]
MEYSDLLDRASQTDDVYLRETYEYIREDKGWKFIAEQVSHHPPISVCICISSNFIFSQKLQAKVKFREIFPDSLNILIFPKYNETITWNKYTICIHNVLSSERWIDHYGDVLVESSFGNKARISFIQSNYRTRLSNVAGDIEDSTGKGASQSQAFSQLKQLLITSPLFLHFPDDNYPVILTTDASEIGIGDTLQQNINGEINNLYYHSQVTSSTQRRYDLIELEALGIWLCFQRMRSYLLGQHNCLADYLSHHPIQNDEEIFDEDYVIGAVVTRSKMKQIKQQQNENDKITSPTVNDISSSSSKDKIEHSNKSPSHLISSNNFDITQIKLEQSKDSNIQKKIKEVMQDPTKHPYVVTDDLLYRLVLINVASNKKKKVIYLLSVKFNFILYLYHNDPLSGHFGIQRTYSKIKNKFW